MVTYGGMSKEHVNVSTSSFIFKVYVHYQHRRQKKFSELTFLA
jgi:hypothetical protein